MKTTDSWTIINVLKEATLFLQSRQIESGRRNAEQLLADVLNLSRVELYMQFDRPLSGQEREDFKRLLRRRGAHEPLQYILGETEFYGYSFKVTPDVLIPRPETELLVDKAIEIVRSRSHQIDPIRILDIGTGSGNIAITLLKAMNNIHVTAMDCSESSLRIAEENASSHQIGERITFQHADIFRDDIMKIHNGPFDIIVSNPPYIASKEMTSLPPEVRNFEPAHALEAGEDGLKFYRRMAELIPRLIKPGGNVLLEIGSTQRESIRTIFPADIMSCIETYQDLAGLDRIVHFQISGRNGKT